MLCAHSHRTLIRSAYSSMPFLSFVCFVLFSIWRQRTCLFTRPDTTRLTIVPTRHPFYTRPQIGRESAHRPLLSTRQWGVPLQQFVRCLTQSAYEYKFEAPSSLQLTFQHASTLIKVWYSPDKIRVSSLGQTMRDWLSYWLVTGFIRDRNLAVYRHIDCCCLCVSGAAASKTS